MSNPKLYQFINEPEPTDAIYKKYIEELKGHNYYYDVSQIARWTGKPRRSARRHIKSLIKRNIMAERF